MSHPRHYAPVSFCARSTCRLRRLAWACCAAVSLVTCAGAVGADSTAAAQKAQVAANPPAQASFDIEEYRVLGNSVLEPRDIERTLYPLLGPGKHLSDVEAARAALEKTYHDHGFATVFVDIPPQTVDEGIVRLRVTEGKLHSSTVTGARYFSERAIAEALPAAKIGTVPNIPELQRELTALNAQTADRSVTPVLKAGPVPGTMDAEFRVTDTLPFHGSLELDNDYTVDTKELRATASLSYSNLFAALDSVSVLYQDSPQAPSEVGLLNVGYQSRAFAGDWRVLVSFTDSNSNVATAGGGALGVLGKGEIYSLRLSDTPIAAPGSLQSVSLGYDYKHFRDAIALGGGSELVTPIYYSNLSVNYSGAIGLPLFDQLWTASANLGLRDAPNNPDAFENKRYLARGNYFYLRGDDSLIIHMPAGFRLTLRAAGQWAQEPLISNENFAIGGAYTVRGYLEAEELGDTGLLANIQLETPTWSLYVPQLFNVFAFYDAGFVRVIDALPGQADYASLSSFGGGISLLPGHAINGVVTWVEALKDGSYTFAHDSRILFTVKGSF